MIPESWSNAFWIIVLGWLCWVCACFYGPNL